MRKFESDGTPKFGVAHYILDERRVPVYEPDMHKWCDWHYHGPDRQVGLDTVGDIIVSTVFYGMALQFGPKVPLFFQTVLFRGEQASNRLEWDTWENAEKGHAFVLEKVRRFMEEAGEISDQLLLALI